MNVITLIENTAPKSLIKEWGLSLYIEYNNKKILLDMGGSDKFLKNAKTLNVPIDQVDYAVLSHGHMDHGGGLQVFINHNTKATVFINSNTKENCFFKYGPLKYYVGLQKNILKENKARLHFVKENYCIDQGMYLVVHTTKHLERIGKESHLYIKDKGVMLPDDFRHEQSLVFLTDQGLVIFNSCCHAGVANIVKEVIDYFPNERVYALVGGFHLTGKGSREIRAIAKEIKSLEIEVLYTGHCTGKKAFGILKTELGDSVKTITAGTKIELTS